MNKTVFELANVTEEEYYKWCRKNKKSAYLIDTKRDFFTKIQQGKLVRNDKGEIVKNTSEIKGEK